MDSIRKSLQELVAGTAPETGVSFFNVFIEHLARAYNAQYAMVTELTENDPVSVRTLAFWKDGQLSENFDYPVKDTPCQQVYKQGAAYFPSGIQQIFNEDKDLVDMEVHSYLGTQLQSHDGKVIGHICVLGSSPLGETDTAQEMLKVFAARASAELERIKMEKEILQHREHLEELVEEKTRELNQARKTAEHASMAKSEFTSRMSHELRTPLNVIIGYTEMLKESLDGSIDKDNMDYLDTILNSGWELLKLIEDVLDLSKLETSEVNESRQEVQLNTILDSCIRKLQVRASEKHIGMVVDDKSTNDIKLVTNSEYLEKIIYNLVSNAIKFNVVQGTVDIVTSMDNNHIRLSVTDTGPGIRKIDQEKVFEKFERLGADKKCIKGAGIGLAMTKHLVEYLQGNIGINSVAGKGSTFWIELPRN